MTGIKIKNYYFDIIAHIFYAIAITAFLPVIITYEDKYDPLSIALFAYGIYFLLSEAFKLYKLSGKVLLEYDGNTISIYDSYDEQVKRISLEEITRITLTKKIFHIDTASNFINIHFDMMTTNNKQFFLSKIYPEIEKKLKSKETEVSSDKAP